MDYRKNPYWQLGLWLILAAVLGLGGCYIWLMSYPWTAIAIALLALMCFGYVFYQLRLLERQWWQMIEYWQGGEKPAFYLYTSYFEQANQQWHKMSHDFERRLEDCESKQLFFETVLKQLPVGVLVFDQYQHCYWYNHAAQQLLPSLREGIALAQLPPEWHEWIEWVRTAHHSEERLFEIVWQHATHSIASRLVNFYMQGLQLTVVSLQHLGHILEDKEMSAWHQLTRVLTHEISNSVTPIVSLTASLREILSEGYEATADIQHAFHLIERRSRELLSFVQEFRTLTQTPSLQRIWVPVKELFEEVLHLLANDIQVHAIEARWLVEPSDLILWADRGLLMQVLINLCKNAIQAMAETEHPRKLLIQAKEAERLLIVEDSGTGISPEAMQHLFVPFFSTKKRGSGIGLSLSRQLVRAHGWRLSVYSEWGKGTRFLIHF